MITVSPMRIAVRDGLTRFLQRVVRVEQKSEQLQALSIRLEANRTIKVVGAVWAKSNVDLILALM